MVNAVVRLYKTETWLDDDEIQEWHEELVFLDERLFNDIRTAENWVKNHVDEYVVAGVAIRSPLARPYVSVAYPMTSPNQFSMDLEQEVLDQMYWSWKVNLKLD